MTLAEEKQVQRKAGIAARRALAPEPRAAANAALCARLAALPCFRQARTILLYAAFGGEADLATLAETARGLGKTLAYPVCGENFSLTAAVPGEDGWEAGAYGIRTPILSRAEILPPEALDLILVPCTAFDAACGVGDALCFKRNAQLHRTGAAGQVAVVVAFAHSHPAAGGVKGGAGH